MVEKLILFISITFLIFSCSIGIDGTYYNKKSNLDYSTISICKDSVYYYGYVVGLGTANYKGTWRINKDTLELNIPKPCKTMNSQLIEDFNFNSGMKLFDCKILRSCGDTMTVFWDTLIINDTLSIQIDSVGKVKTKIGKVEKIEFVPLVFKDLYPETVFIPTNSKSNQFEILIGETDEVQLANYSLIHQRFLITNSSLQAIYTRKDSIEISDFKYKRHKRKCVKK